MYSVQHSYLLCSSHCVHVLVDVMLMVSLKLHDVISCAQCYSQAISNAFEDVSGIALYECQWFMQTVVVMKNI